MKDLAAAIQFAKDLCNAITQIDDSGMTADAKNQLYVAKFDQLQIVRRLELVLKSATKQTEHRADDRLRKRIGK